MNFISFLNKKIEFNSEEYSFLKRIVKDYKPLSSIAVILQKNILKKLENK